MWTTPLHLWKQQASKFDLMIQKAIQGILGFPMNEVTLMQVCLTPKLGGLGLRRVTEHAGMAYHASWHESMKTAKEVWVAPPGMSAEHVPQSVASFDFDEKRHAFLVSTAPNEREAQRLRRCAQPHANGFITAVPSEEDGRDTLLKPRVFRTAVAYRLGVPVLDKEIPCPLCKQTINIYGDHATCCTKNGDIIIRHNTLRNLIDNFASDGLLSPELEKQGILGNTTGRRPGDVTLHRWDAGGALAIDVAITSALGKASIRRESPCEEYALTQKHGKYDKSFAETNYSFCAMVWETLGALNSEGEEVLRQIFRFAAKQLGCEFSSYCGRAWARISCCLQRSVGQAILNRIDGREFRDPAILAEPDTFVAPDQSKCEPVLEAPSTLTPVQVLECVPLPLPASAVPPPLSTQTEYPSGGLVLVKADGDCCYHLAGVIRRLCKSPEVVPEVQAPCSNEDIAQARTLILGNFHSVSNSKSEFFPSPQELEDHIVTIIGESSDKFVERVSGKARKDERLGSSIDLSMAMFREDVRVMVIDAEMISRDTPDQDLGKAVKFEPTPGECDKKRVVCAVLHRKHFDLGVVRAAQGVRAVFAAGQEWDDACRLILSFVKANSTPKGQVSVSLGPRWCEATGEGKCEDSEGKGKEVGESEGEGKKRKRAGVKEKGGCEVKSRACEKIITRGGGSKMHAHTLSVSASPRVTGVESSRSGRLTRQHDMHIPNATRVSDRVVISDKSKSGSVQDTSHT
jgi:hypothetical protein